MSEKEDNIGDFISTEAKLPFRDEVSERKPPFRVGAELSPGVHIDAPPIIFQRAEELRNRETETEQILWEELRGKKLEGNKFRRQHPIMSYVLDFYCHPHKLAIEIDGKYHETKEQREYDRMRTEELQEIGLAVIRFTNAEVLENIAEVKKTILLKIETLTKS